MITWDTLYDWKPKVAVDPKVWHLVVTFFHDETLRITSVHEFERLMRTIEEIAFDIQQSLQDGINLAKDRGILVK